MADLNDHQSGKTTKLLLIGDSGSGKTGSLAALASYGYNIRIVDLDNGIDVLANLLKSKTGPYAGLGGLGRVKFETITDKMKSVGNRLMPDKATVWTRTAELLTNWGPPRSKDNLGPLTNWTTQDVLVIDSLTFLAQAALNFNLTLNARLGQRPHQSDWYDGQLYIENLLQMLYDDQIKCNVIVISHITYIDAENGVSTGYPTTLGKALSPKVGRYFNSVLQFKTVGQGQNQKKVLLTSTSSNIELKNTNPLAVKPQYDIVWGLAEYFCAIRGENFVIPSPKPTVVAAPQAEAVAT